VQWYLPRIVAETGPIQDRVSQKIRAKGGVVRYRYTLFNGISAAVPKHIIPDLMADPEVESVFEDRRMAASLDVSVPSIGTLAFWNAGYLGGGWDVGILDTGMDTSHPAFAGKSFIPGIFLSTGQDDACFDDDATTVDDKVGHGTHVGGIVMSQGSAGWEFYQGVAKGLAQTLALKVGFLCTDGKAYAYNSDVLAGIDWALTSAPDLADVLNYSFGGPTSQDDDPFSLLMDNAVDIHGVPIVVAAGNYDESVPESRYVQFPGIAYNVITVANAFDNNTLTRSDDQIWKTSSWGPTAGLDCPTAERCGRKKPDLAAPGTKIVSTNYDWEGLLGLNPDFVENTGTSMAAPHVAGAAVLVGSRLSWGGTSKEIKAILINTADDMGPEGWDESWGWGYVNLSRAYGNNSGFSGELWPNGEYGHFALYKGSTLNKPGKATLVWNRHPGYQFGCGSSSSNVLNDLDLFAYDEADGSLIDSSISTIDNVEQVQVPGVSSVILRVHAYCSDFGGLSYEPYALALDNGFAGAAGPYTDVTVPNRNMAPGQQLILSIEVSIANVSWYLPAHSNSVTLNVPEGFSIVAGANPQALSPSSISVGQTGTATWTVQASSTPGTYYATATNSSQSYGEEFSNTGTGLWEVSSGFLPSVTTLIASSVTTTAATLNGSVNPNGAATDAWFEYGTDSLLSSYYSTPSQSVGSGSTSLPVSHPLSGLAPSTRYYYRVAASNAGGTARGTIVSFTTSVSALTFSPPSVLFGSQAVNTSSSPYPVMLMNTGGAPATLYSIGISGGNNDDFTRSDDCPISPSTLASGASCTIQVTFTPKAAGPRKSSVVITDSAVGSPHAVILTGLGTQ